MSRTEARDRIDFLPLPTEIEILKRRVREERPMSQFNDQWVGLDGPGIKEIF